MLNNERKTGECSLYVWRCLLSARCSTDVFTRTGREQFQDEGPSVSYTENLQNVIGERKTNNMVSAHAASKLEKNYKGIQSSQ